MFNKSKLKMSLSHYIALLGFLFLISLITEDLLWGTRYSIWIWGAIIIIWSILYSLRTKLLVILINGLVVGSAAWHYTLASHYETIFSLRSWFLHMAVIILFSFLAWGKTIRIHDRLETYARKIFDLAASSLEETKDGFTSRPFSAGSAEYSREETIGFARFLKTKNISTFNVSEKSVFLIFSMVISPLSNPDLQQVSYISFDADNNLSVHISQADYRLYKEQLTFDQLCISLANVFKRFLEYYKHNNESRILDELSSASS
jgi:hypothetical protein